MVGSHVDLIGRDIVDQINQDTRLRHCTILSNVPIQLPGFSFIAIGPNNLDLDVAKMADFIHKTTWCLIAIIHLGIHSNLPLLTLRTLIERNVHANVFLIGDKMIDLDIWNRPVIYLERTAIGRLGFVSSLFLYVL